jgi:hypothetical protein
MKPMACLVLLLVLAGAVHAAAPDWQRAQEQSVVQILTHDEDGAQRETSVWIVSFDGCGYVRTNDSRWLANIRRGSTVALRLDDGEFPVAAREPNDAAITARVEEQFKQKYGFMQKVMSAFRFREPTVLELTAR